MVSYSSIFPLSGGGNGATNTLLLLRPVDGRIVDLVSEREPTTLIYPSSSLSSNGYISLDSVEKKFNQSIRIEKALISTFNNHIYNQDLTIELWHKQSGGTAATYDVLFGKSPFDGAAHQSIYLGYSSSICGAYWGDGANYKGIGNFSSNTIPSDWNHWALVRNSNTITLYLNGASKGSDTAGNIFDLGVLDQRANHVSGSLCFGSAWFTYQSLDTRCRNGWYEEIRVSNVARYTANFTPPTAPFEID